MKITCASRLDSEQTDQWRRLLAAAAHSHAEQDPCFADVHRADGNEILFAMGWQGETLCAAGMFVMHPHPYIRGKYNYATALSGPVCDDAGQMATFMELLAHDPAMRAVGVLRLTPYWLDEQATALAEVLTAKGWLPFETIAYRQTGIVDISGSATEIAARFNQTARRKLRKAERIDLVLKPVTTEEEALEFHASMNRHRAQRGLVSISWARFATAFHNVYKPGELGVILVIRHAGRFVAGVVVHRGPKTAHFMHSTHEDAILAELDDLRIAPFLLLEAMKWANARECQLFDLEGFKLPLDSADELYNIYKYKTEFNPRLASRLQGRQKIIRPMIYLSGSAREIAKSWVRTYFKRVKVKKPRPTENA